MANDKEQPEIIAYEADQSLRKMVGKTTVLTDIFTKDKIAASQKLIDEAKDSFFDRAKPDMDAISELVKDKAAAENYQELCRHLFQPVCNIKSQADIFGFPLISCVCKYLIEYSEASAKKAMTAKDIFLIGKLVEALQRAFKNKIVDAGGAIEKELVSLVEQARK